MRTVWNLIGETRRKGVAEIFPRNPNQAKLGWSWVILSLPLSFWILNSLQKFFVNLPGLSQGREPGKRKGLIREDLQLLVWWSAVEGPWSLYPGGFFGCLSSEKKDSMMDFWSEVVLGIIVLWVLLGTTTIFMKFLFGRRCKVPQTKL